MNTNRIHVCMFQKTTMEPMAHNRSVSHDQDMVETVVGPSVHVEGDFSSEGNILVKGSVAGNVKTSRLLTVEEGAKISANVRAGDALIAGEINGNVSADNKVELSSSARVLGDIVCKVLAVEAGALVHGKIMMHGIEPDKSSGKKRVSSRVRSTDSEDEVDGDTQ